MALSNAGRSDVPRRRSIIARNSRCAFDSWVSKEVTAVPCAAAGSRAAGRTPVNGVREALSSIPLISSSVMRSDARMPLMQATRVSKVSGVVMFLLSSYYFNQVNSFPVQDPIPSSGFKRIPFT